VENEILSNETNFATLDIPERSFTIKEVRAVIRNVNPPEKKMPDYDFITNQILQKLPQIGMKYISQLCNAILRQGFFPLQWEIANIMIQKPGKSAEYAESYRAISLLLIETI
jgi:hypothetical protein